MDESKRYFRLGLFVFVAIAIVGGIVFVLGGRALFQPTMMIETYFNESVAGLDIGAPIKFRGVPMGQVTEILLSTVEYEWGKPPEQRRGYIVVRAKLSLSKERIQRLGNDATDLIKSGLRIQTQMAGITGQQTLAVDIFDPDKYPPLPFDWTPKYLYVPSAPSTTGELIAGVQAFLASLNKADVGDLGKNLNTLIVTLNKKVSEVAAGEISTEATDTLKDVRVLIDRAADLLAKPEIEAMLRNLASATGRVDTLVGDPSLKRILGETAALTTRLNQFIQSGSIDRTVQSANDVAERTSVLIGDNQFDIRVIVQDLRVTAENLRVLSDTLKRNPAGFLLGGPPEKTQLPGKTP